MPTWIHVEIIHYKNIVPLVQNSPSGTSELFPFCENWYLGRYCSLWRHCPAGTSEFVSFWRQIGSHLGMKNPGDSFLGIPLGFCWRLGNNYFWRQLESSLKFSRWHLRIDSIWRQLILSFGFVILRYSVSGISPCFPPFGFTLLIRLWGTIFSLLWVYCYSLFLGYYINH